MDREDESMKVRFSIAICLTIIASSPVAAQVIYAQAGAVSKVEARSLFVATSGGRLALPWRRACFFTSRILLLLPMTGA